MGSSWSTWTLLFPRCCPSLPPPACWRPPCPRRHCSPAQAPPHQHRVSQEILAIVAADAKRAEVKTEEGLDVAMGEVEDAAGPSEEPPSALSDVHRAFLRFTGQDEEAAAGAAEAPADDARLKEEDAKDKFVDDGDGEGYAADKLSKKKRRQLETMKVAELKRACARPDVVEVWDVRAPDPQLLVHLKAYRNAVPVPRHWSQKRQYLQGKRGLEKPPFELPEYIKATGITDMRDAYLEKEAASKQKQQARSRMRPKMGKIEIEYEVRR